MAQEGWPQPATGLPFMRPGDLFCGPWEGLSSETMTKTQSQDLLAPLGREPRQRPAGRWQQDKGSELLESAIPEAAQGLPSMEAIFCLN